jgi:hypothetical protein
VERAECPYGVVRRVVLATRGAPATLLIVWGGTSALKRECENVLLQIVYPVLQMGWSVIFSSLIRYRESKRRSDWSYPSQ